MKDRERSSISKLVDLINSFIWFVPDIGCYCSCINYSVQLENK